MEDNKVVTGFSHLEMLVANPKAAAKFMEEVFGAVRVEVNFANLIERDFDCECIHMQAGGVIYQLIRPNDQFMPSLSHWWKRNLLKEHGSCIHNVSIQARNPDAFAKKLVELGGTKMGQVVSITPDGVGRCGVYMYDFSKQCGMMIEFIQTPPASPTTRINDDSIVTGFSHLEMLVDDPEAAAKFMADTFGAIRVEVEFAKLIERDFDCECIHMQAGGIIYQLIRPNDKFRSELATWWRRDMLKTVGSCIHNISIQVRNPDTFAANLVAHGAKKMGQVVSITPDGKGHCGVYMYDAREQCGMIIEFIQTPPKA